MPITTLISDFSQVIIFPTDTTHKGSLSSLYRKVSQEDAYQFRNHFTFNTDYLNFLKSIQNNIDLHILTASGFVTAPEVQAIVKPIFQETFQAQDFEYTKQEPQLYQQISEKLEVKPGKMMFIDDSLDNIKAALHAGLHAVHYHDTGKLLHHLRTQLT